MGISRQLRKKTSTGKIIAFILFSLYSATLIFAWGWVLVQSFKDPDVFINDKISIPWPPTFANYVDAFKNLSVANGVGMFGMIINSVWYTVGSLLVQMASSVACAYVIAKFKFPGRNLLFSIALITMMIPVVGSMPSAFRVYDALGMLDSPLIILRCLNAFGWNFVVIHGFFKALSWSYAESAYIDGANHFQAFFNVMLPQVAAPVFALCIMSFINLWNDYMTPLVYFPSWPTLVTGLYLYENEMGRMLNYPTLFAGVLICVLPVITIFIAFQKQILEINISGGLKG